MNNNAILTLNEEIKKRLTQESIMNQKNRLKEMDEIKLREIAFDVELLIMRLENDKQRELERAKNLKIIN